MIELSILVPVYNAQDYLKRCIKSLLAQTISNYEIILVDDGSTDESGKICDLYANEDDRIKVVHQKNKGLAGARIAGINNSNGKYIGFVDSDDYVDETMFEKLLAPTRLCEQIDISIGGHVVDEMDGKIKFPCSALGTKMWEDGIQAMAEMFKGEKFVWSLCDKIYNKKLFSAECLEHWPCSYGEDTYTNSLVMPKARKIIFQPIYEYHYCMHSNSMIHKTFNLSKLDTVYIVADIMEKYKDCIDLAQSLRKQLFLYLEEYLKEMILAEDMYALDLKKCRNIAKKWLIDGNNNTIQSEIMNVLSMDYDTYKKWIVCEKIKINNFCSRNASQLYIYGIGIYGERTAEYLSQNGMSFKGFIETNPSVEKFMNHDVYHIDEIEKTANILLGLGLNNTISVKESIKDLYRNIYCMYTYFSCTSRK